ncbi:MAG TPA: signal peptidase I [Firmicutes bacterium]|nr:signal peptidase I [Bacillota bacterium]
MEPAEEEVAGEEKQGKREKGSLASDLFDWAEALVYALALLVVVCAFFVRLSGVQGTSMYPTLDNGDQLLLLSFGYNEPERGDIVVLMADDFMDKPLVKRVIGIGGDVIDMDPSGTVTVNGEALYEPYINDLNGQDMYLGDIQFPLTVPDGQVFVMGDNRNGSSDSRKAEVGTIPYEKIVGKAVFRLFPFNRMGRIE